MTRNELIDLIARQTNEYRAQLESYLDTFDQYAQLASEQNELRYALINEHNERERIKLDRLIRAIDGEKHDLNQSIWQVGLDMNRLTSQHQNERYQAIDFDEPPF